MPSLPPRAIASQRDHRHNLGRPLNLPSASDFTGDRIKECATQYKFGGRRVMNVCVWVFLVNLNCFTWPAYAERAAVLEKPAPETVEDLREIQQRVEAVAARCGPATVALQVGPVEFGSGVIVSSDGLILSAAHVVGEPDRLIQVYLPDGRVFNAHTLGSGAEKDGGMAKLDDAGPWPYVNLADPEALRRGDWVVALGHPGGFDANRPVVVRLGRAIRLRSFRIQSDCSLVGGDSGGPLFDLEGNLVGIHSHIGESMRSNFDVPIGYFLESWDRLREPHKAMFLGISVESHDRGVRVTRLEPGGAGDVAGLREGDVIESVNGRAVDSDETLAKVVESLPAEEPLRFLAFRGLEALELEVTLGRPVAP